MSSLSASADLPARAQPPGTSGADLAFLAGLLGAIPDSVIYTDLDGKIQFWNHGATEVFGYSADEMLGRSPAVLYLEEAPDTLAVDLSRTWAGEDFIAERHGRRKDGGSIWVDVRTTLVRDSKGAAVGFLGVAKDVTPRKRTTEALRDSEERLTLARSAARLGIWDWDLATGSMIYTPEYFALHGLGPNAPSPSYEHWRDHLLDSQDRDRVVREVQVALAGGRPYDTEYRVVWPDGAMHWLAARGQILRDPEGQPIRMLGVCFDVTRRRDAEEQLRQLDRLESVGRLAGGVAHEANNQMAVVLGAAAFVLRRSDLHEETRRDLMDIRHAAERTAAITKQLLAFSRRQVLSPQVLDLNALVQSFEAVLRRTLGEDIVLHVSARAERPQVYADEGQLHQMLLNLIVNARDAMEEGGELTIETGNVALDESAGAAHGVAVRAGPYVALWVRDNGCGMDPQTLAHAFEPFFTTKGVGRGTGLGLASVYGIVHQSDGYVFAESQPSKGTTFSILLPLSGDPIKASGMPPETSPEAVGKTALVIEDEPIVRAMLARTLRQAGFEVWDAADGHAALELVRSLEHPLDVVVTDLAIPGIRGRELADALTKLRPGLPLLFVSGYPGEEMVRQGLIETGCPFLQKPFEPEMLVRKVHELLGQSVPQSEP